MKYLVIFIFLFGWSGTKKFLFMYLFPDLLTLLPLIPFDAEEITGSTNEAARGAKKAPRNQASHVLLFQ